MAKKPVSGSLLWPLAILLFLVLLLRFPTLFEPYWYADEGIYLTIGQALRSGWHLYTDIFDHKTPLIYLFATLSSNVMIWKTWGTIFSLIATVFFYFIVQKLTAPRRWPTIIASLIFVCLFNLPFLEGNIVNGEIFFMTFGLAGIFFWLKTDLWPLSDQYPLESKINSPKSKSSSRQNFIWAMAAGISLALAFLIKFHGLADLAAIALPTLLLPITLLKKNRSSLICLGVGFLLTLLATVLVFTARGDLSAFWDRAFNFSFHYSEYTQIAASGSFAHAFMSTSGKLWALVGGAILLWVFRRRLTLPVTFAAWWLLITTIAASLSNRAYPHYFLQLTPALALVVILFLITFFNLLSQFFSSNFKKTSLSTTLITPLITLLILAMTGVYTYLTIHFIDLKITNIEDKTRQTLPYYLNFGKYIFGLQNNFSFYHFFDPNLKDNYAVADLITDQTENDRLMIWGNNPQLYAQTHTLPITAFLVNYHLYDEYFDQDLQANLELAWAKNTPTFVVWMKNYDAWNARSQADEAWLRGELASNYTRLYEGSSLELWHKNL